MKKAKAISLVMVAIIFIAILIGGASPRTQVSLAHDYLIIPGKRIGNFTLDRTIQSYLQELGANPLIHRNLGGTGIDAYSWVARGVSILTRENVIVAIYILSQMINHNYTGGDPQTVALQRRLERYRTPEGLSLGQSVARVRALYGKPERMHPIYETERIRLIGFVYSEIGLWVTIESKATPETVLVLGVFRPETPRWW